ncbi:MAG: M20/M25/M40 family metallo-hydrolase [Bacteroidales bacterium]
MKHERRTVLAATLIAASALIFVVPAAPRTDGTVLVTIDKVQPRMPAASLVQQMRTVVELEDRWLVRLPATSLPELETGMIRHQVLDVDAYGTGLLLLGRATPEDVELLRQMGGVFALGDGTYLLATAAPPDRDRLPANVSVERIGDGLPVVPTFVRPNLARAVARRPLTTNVRYRSPIADMVAQVNQNSLANTITALEGFKTRFATTWNCEAAGDVLFSMFADLGLSVERDSFTFGTYRSNNIVATLPGRVTPSQVVIVGAHYDSYSNAASTAAPGADDNASGTAAVVELARIMAPYPFDYTVKFIAFSAEEWGLYGSKHYAQAARAAGEHIIGMVNLDMVGFTDTVPEDLDLIVNDSSGWLATAFINAAALYAPMPTVTRVNASMRGSDHAPFWDQGYSALCGIEDQTLVNPNYHKVTDTVSTLNMEFETATARAALATIATLAQPYNVLPPPQDVRAQAQTLATALMRARSVYLSWTAAPNAAGYFVYRGVASHGPYQRLNSSPVKSTGFVDRFVPLATTCYYVVTSADAAGVEGNYSVEVVVGK